jgi:predicted transcriptional regulator
MVKIERFQIDNRGLGKFFSPIEVRLLELLWKLKKATSIEIQETCPDLSVACVAGTLDRLVKSGFVKKEADKSTKRVRFFYSPTGTKKEAETKISERILESLVDTFGTSVVDAFDNVRARRK